MSIQQLDISKGVRAGVLRLVMASAVAAAGLLVVACAADIPAETLVQGLADPATRGVSVERLMSRYQEKLLRDGGDRNGPNVKPLLDLILVPLEDLAKSSELDKRTRIDLLAMLADARSGRAAATAVVLPPAAPVVVPAVGSCAAASAYRTAVTCTPAVLVVRHAEDQKVGFGLTAAGKNHAALYPEMVNTYVYGKAHGLGPAGEDVCVCPVSKIIAVDPKPNSINANPSSNPYNTIEPLAKALGIAITVKDAAEVSYTSCYNWNTAARQALLRGADGAATSTVVAWDKQGLNWAKDDVVNLTAWCKLAPTAEPLLKKLPKVFTLEPNGVPFTAQRSHFFVFAGQDPTDGKFATFTRYQQTYSLDGKTWYMTDVLTDLPKFIQLAKF